MLRTHVCIALLAGPLGFAGMAQSTTRPNILVIVADDHRQDLIGKYHGIVQTPTLDDLCNNGVYFRNSYVTTPICAASRASIFTGLTERTHGYTFGEPAVPAQFASTAYPKLLKENGYQTYFVGKYGCSLSGSHDERFHDYSIRSQQINETYEGKSIPQTYYIANVACDYIDDAATNHPGEPWCVSVSFWNPHAHDADLDDQYHYPPEFDTLYDDVTLPEARISDEATFNALPQFIRESKCRERWGWRYDTPEKFQRMTKRYYRAITAVDKGVQIIRNKLSALNIDDHTVIIYIGDNGYMINERQLAGKWLGWEECLRVPLIVYDPRTNALHGVELEQPALNIDLAPTIVELAGVPIPEMYQGRSLFPLMTGETPLWREEFFFEHYFLASGGTLIPRNEGVRTRNWKYVKFVLDDHEQLYDLSADPGEVTNLAYSAAYSNTIEQLRHASTAYVELYDGWPRQPPSDGWMVADNRDGAIVYSGAWTVQNEANDYAGSMSWANGSGDYAAFTFEGDALGVGVRKGGSGGICDVYVDDVLVTNDVDTYNPSKIHQTVIYEADLASGTHTVRLEATGQKNPSSNQANIMFDYFAYRSGDAPAPFTDNDADGLPDTWEVQYLETLFRLPGDDDDNDGYPNGHEYVAGTHPKDASSLLFVEQGIPDGGDATVNWHSVSNRVYVVQRTGALLTHANWDSISGPLEGDGQRIEFVDTASSAHSNAFYRVEVSFVR